MINIKKYLGLLMIIIHFSIIILSHLNYNYSLCIALTCLFTLDFNRFIIYFNSSMIIIDRSFEHYCLISEFTKLSKIFRTIHFSNYYKDL